MSKRNKFAAVLMALSYVVYVAIGANAIRGLTAIDLVYAAISYEEAPGYIRPTILQRAIAERVLERQLASGQINPHGAFDLTAGLPLAMTHFKYSELVHDSRRAKEAKERIRAMELTKFLRDHGVNMESVNESGCTVLQAMALFGEREFYNYLLTLGADPNSVNDEAPAKSCRSPAKELAARTWDDLPAP